ncbi:unnamed protein product [Larinioides sclopetarius]|uniref:Uncharacterized protein n=1 Tax=Larinioides sclopetarius TaxID=280406 RepID=A0AAV2BEK5_9ARAC
MFLWICFLAFVGSIFCHEANEVPLNKALESLERALQYMNETVSAINLDAVFCIRRLEVGLCGIWGYKDFNKPEWLQKILEWQEPSGCYASSESYKCFDAPAPTNHVRVKRSEKLLSDGCLSHETGVALLALAANVRFEAEKEYEINKEKRSSMLFMK